MKICYIAFDDIIFDSKEECETYERSKSDYLDFVKQYDDNMTVDSTRNWTKIPFFVMYNMPTIALDNLIEDIITFYGIHDVDVIERVKKYLKRGPGIYQWDSDAKCYFKVDKRITKIAQ